MKKLIRKSVFETNSSSAHSISMASEDKEFVLDTIYPDQFGRIYVYGGEYGWEWRKYNDAVTKLSYAYQDEVDTELLEKVVKTQTGATEVIFDGKSKEDGYIDHDSYGIAQDVCKDEESTRNFIFNKNSWLFTGNDNSQADPMFYNVPTYCSDKIIAPVYEYELSIDGLKQKTMFLKEPTKEELSNGIDSLLQGYLMNEHGDFIPSGDIFFQIARSRDMFEISYQVDQDYDTGNIIMTREGGWLYNLDEQMELDIPGYKEMDWKKRKTLRNKEILKDNNNCKLVKFTLKKL